MYNQYFNVSFLKFCLSVVAISILLEEYAVTIYKKKMIQILLFNLWIAASRWIYILLTWVNILLDNPYDTADKWLLKENLPISYRQQVVDFILENTGQKAFSFDPTFRDPYTGCKLQPYCFSVVFEWPSSN